MNYQTPGLGNAVATLLNGLGRDATAEGQAKLHAAQRDRLRQELDARKALGDAIIGGAGMTPADMARNVYGLGVQVSDDFARTAPDYMRGAGMAIYGTPGLGQRGAADLALGAGGAYRDTELGLGDQLALDRHGYDQQLAGVRYTADREAAATLGAPVVLKPGEMAVDPATLRAGIIETANAIGADPLDLATAISYETAGTFDPTKPGPTTQWGQHRGLIQFGEPQAIQYGVDWNDPLGSQLGADGAIADYFRQNGYQPGMSGLDLYSTINAGAPGRYSASDAQNGGAPGSVADKWNNQMDGHRAKARALLGYSEAPPVNAGLGDVALPPTPGVIVNRQPEVLDPEQRLAVTDPFGQTRVGVAPIPGAVEASTAKASAEAEKALGDAALAVSEAAMTDARLNAGMLTTGAGGQASPQDAALLDPEKADQLKLLAGSVVQAALGTDAPIPDEIATAVMQEAASILSANPGAGWAAALQAAVRNLHPQLGVVQAPGLLGTRLFGGSEVRMNPTPAPAAAPAAAGTMGGVGYRILD